MPLNDNGTKKAFCTIVSRNYLPFAKVLFASLRDLHPEASRYVLLADQPADELDSGNLFELIPVEEIGIPDFRSIAFKYDILELNTAVKPSFLKYLFARYGIEQLIYLDPDIRAYSEFDDVFASLENNSIVVTPHTVMPIEDSQRPSETDFLLAGVFNLGFIGVNSSSEARAFLDWWEKRCLSLGFNDPRNGLFVDQKWTNFLPCFFDKVHILRSPAYNVGYWNLHERVIERRGAEYFVNGHKLVFYHFSGITFNNSGEISKHTNRYTLAARPDLVPLFAEYRGLILEAGYETYRVLPYAWGMFSNGRKINPLTRVVYSLQELSVRCDDPFNESSQFYRWANSMNVLAIGDSTTTYNSRTYNPLDWRLRILHWFMRLSVRLLGGSTYALLMKYLSYVSILRNQGQIFQQDSKRQTHNET
jgi:hypothetical protein